MWLVKNHVKAWKFQYELKFFDKKTKITTFKIFQMIISYIGKIAMHFNLKIPI
jgi:hypothetical protein